ncbi:thiamine phosphate synthase [Comamonas piscis]|uniref:Thiamine phosphate synthase n=1 Tax=Comamonas piscis TaxID=1562974 RepID=A0A7G5EIE0_9BURK|nr:thiamine phosphate synthase [Comamonas piscis]QMV73765.1 thiamine phosphate synthase [Comamonas piscis]WSO32189.1 thiamine phosphate synthase [Comamonas piscis]
MNTPSPSTATQIAQAITAAHQAAFANFPPQTAPDLPSDRQQDAVYAGALAACSTLGFIAIDAACIASAWSAQAARTGQFDAQAWPVEAADFGLRPSGGPQAFVPCPQQLGLYAVLPTAEWVGRMARAGVPTVQLRFKSDDAQAITAEIAAAVAAVEETSALLFINDHWRHAIAAGSYGVHLGQEDLDALSAAELAELRASGVRLGVSTHGYAEMVRASQAQPSYIAMGAVFPTTLKKMATVPQGLARLERYAALTRSYPQVAIGGISAAEFPLVRESGVGSIAVVRAIVNADDPEAAAADLMALMG